METRKYTVITGEGYWGKGSTALEAAQNANVRGKWVHGAVYYAADKMVEGEIHCTGMGGYSLEWKDDFWPILEEHPVLRGIAEAYITKASGQLKIVKGKLLVQAEVE